MKVSEYIKKYRFNNNLTQQALADKLFVTKQTISKWENDKGLPDTGMYITLANVLGVSVDELMGNNTNNQPQKRRLSKKTIIILVIVGILVILFSTALIIGIVKTSQNNNELEKIKETEEYLKVELPKIKEYNYIDYFEWKSYNNSIYPEKMYYFVFENESIKIDETWMNKLDQELIDKIPIGSSEYPYICDYFKIINTTTQEINKIEDPNLEKQEYLLYCLQIEKKRLIVITFEV